MRASKTVLRAYFTATNSELKIRRDIAARCPTLQLGVACFWCRDNTKMDFCVLSIELVLCMKYCTKQNAALACTFMHFTKYMKISDCIPTFHTKHSMYGAVILSLTSYKHSAVYMACGMKLLPEI